MDISDQIIPEPVSHPKVECGINHDYSIPRIAPSIAVTLLTEVKAET